MPLTTDEKRALREIRLLFGKSDRELNELLESAGITVILSYLWRKPIVIPFIGKIHIIPDGATGTRYVFTPSPFLVTSASQITEGIEADVVSFLAKRFKPIRVAHRLSGNAGSPVKKGKTSCF